MKSHRTLFILLVLIAVIAVLHIAGLYLDLYFRIPNYDRVVHGLAGLWVTIIILLLINKYFVALSHTYSVFIIGFSSALIIGLLWEIFEWKIGFTSVADKTFLSDTSSDLIFDMIGGIIGSAYVTYHFHLWTKKISQ